MHRSPYARRSAFTLIELLVVIAIVLIIAAIALPIYQQVQAKGYQTKTLSNMRQMGTALVMYSADHDFGLPNRVVNDPTTGQPSGDKWPKVLQPYVQNLDLYISPIPDVNGTSYKVADHTLLLSNTTNYTSYIYNGGNDMVPLGTTGTYPRMNMIAYPTKTILLGIPLPKKNNFYMDLSEGQGNNTTILNKSAFPIGSVYVMADGSASFLAVDPKGDAASNKLEPTRGDVYTDWLWLFDKTKTNLIQ